MDKVVSIFGDMRGNRCGRLIGKLNAEAIRKHLPFTSQLNIPVCRQKVHRENPPASDSYRVIIAKEAAKAYL